MIFILRQEKRVLSLSMVEILEKKILFYVFGVEFMKFILEK